MMNLDELLIISKNLARWLFSPEYIPRDCFSTPLDADGRVEDRLASARPWLDGSGGNFFALSPSNYTQMKQFEELMTRAPSET
jgi:hypothetical protein